MRTHAHTHTHTCKGLRVALGDKLLDRRQEEAARVAIRRRVGRGRGRQGRGRPCAAAGIRRRVGPLAAVAAVFLDHVLLLSVVFCIFFVLMLSPPPMPNPTRPPPLGCLRSKKTCKYHVGPGCHEGAAHITTRTRLPRRRQTRHGQTHTHTNTAATKAPHTCTQARLPRRRHTHTQTQLP